MDLKRLIKLMKRKELKIDNETVQLLQQLADKKGIKLGDLIDLILQS